MMCGLSTGNDDAEQEAARSILNTTGTLLTVGQSKLRSGKRLLPEVTTLQYKVKILRNRAKLREQGLIVGNDLRVTETKIQGWLDYDVQILTHREISTYTGYQKLRIHDTCSRRERAILYIRKQGPAKTYEEMKPKAETVSAAVQVMTASKAPNPVAKGFTR